MKFFSKINFKIILLLGFIILLIGTILSVNFIPVSTSNMTYEEKKILLNEFAINLKLGRQLQFISLLFFIVGIYLKIKRK
ncbi:hypothetical protein K0I04_001378 [Enterococcus faecalis]|uniref:Uncharacterized protein n=1 Tax=Enterococcus faecalis TaxID=1351 RepID=A0AAP6RFD7_ENTFL|nr:MULTISPECIES: hypothetical protein [Enterococcus]ETC92659.1 hypothetical protein T481_05535 [Enterococcus faecalis PF3]AQL54461.1 hypothetical protein BZG32_12445 [Enterococcus faecalis]AXG89284.1 hypothetical protein DTO64_12250 [Enterococcus faecalis]AYZ07245.1 hypothetical protein EGX75_08375 [Enterococcus faecalis]EFM72011.1 hypothetical protein HMPREF9515_02905 [Enterococcus faecalis TX0860]